MVLSVSELLRKYEVNAHGENNFLFSNFVVWKKK